MKRVFFTLLTGFATVFVFWYGGVDLDKRGWAQGFVSAFTIYACFMAYFFPGWKEKSPQAAKPGGEEQWQLHC